MKRLYYLTADVNTAENVSNEFHRHGITDWNFHVMSKNKNSLKQHHLHSTNKGIHERDMLRIAERGALLGICAGLACTISFILLTPLLEVRILSVAVFIVLSTLFSLLGAIAGGIFGIAFENKKIERFHDELQSGKYLIMIDVKKQDIPYARNLMSAHHNVIDAGEGSSFVAPFQFST